MSTWPERAAERSPLVHRSRARSIEQARSMVDAALRLIAQKGEQFTTQELVREAGVALQTFYRHFEGKDHLLLAVVEDTIAAAAVAFEEAAAGLSDPVDRLHSYVTAALSGVTAADTTAARFITAEHWRLHQLMPAEVALATKPMTDLYLREILAGQTEGTLHPADPERAAWLMTKLVMAAFHHYAFASDDAGVDTIAEDVWSFCLAAIGAAPHPSPPVATRRPKASGPSRTAPAPRRKGPSVGG